jgi:hypothetical protein
MINSMTYFLFKLLGGVGDRSEAEIDVDFDLDVQGVKELVKRAFKIIPTMSVDFMIGGRKVSDSTSWGMAVIDIKPEKDTILVIGHRD